MHWKEYLQELSQIKTLSLEQEAELWRRYKDGQDENARQTLIESYQPLVFRTALPYRSMDCIMDMVQEGTVGLIEAAETFDCTRGTAFSLYAVHRIRGRMLDYLRREGRAGELSIDADSATWENHLMDLAPSVPEQAETRELVHHLRQAMDRLPQRERVVLEGIYLNSEAPQDMAEGLHLSLSHVYRLQKKGIQRVRGMLSKFMHHWK